MDRIARRRILVERSQCWFAQHAITCRSIPADRNAKDRGLRVIVRGLLSLLTSSDRQGSFPETFYLDFDRLRVLRAEFRDQVYLGVATDTFKSLLRRIGFARSVPDNHVQALREAVSAIVVVNEVAGTSSNQHWLVNIDNISLEIVRHALSLCGAETNYNAELVDATAERLRHLIRPEFGMVFHEQASAMRESLAARVMKSTESFASSSPVDIFNALITSPTASTVCSISNQEEPQGPEAEYLDDIARRITHIAVLHWRIWGNIVYSQTTAFTTLMRNPIPEPSTSSSLSSTATLFDINASAASWADDGFGTPSAQSSPDPEEQHSHQQQNLPPQRARRWSSANERRPPTTSSAEPGAAALSAPPSQQGGSNEQPEDQGSGSATGGLERLVYRQR